MKSAAFLDFDGVLCDSLLECFVSSYIGYYTYYLKQKPFSVERNRFTKFRKLRPFIRRGADYLLLHKILDENRICSTQAEFDEILHREGESLSDSFHSISYQVREELLGKERGYWLSLNKLYTGLENHVRNWAGNPLIYILSTKKADFIREILQAWNIDWPIERILYSGKETKGNIILKQMETSGADEAFFIEDQIDHLHKIEVEHIHCALASWGYVQDEWITQDRYPVYNIQDLIKKMELIH